MLPILALISATLGLYLICFLIYREEKEEIGSFEKQALVAGAVLITCTALWQIAAQWPSGAGGH